MVERLFSNLNQDTLKREPESLSTAIFLVAGTTVGAGILAIPAVTQESGFLASAVACILCWIYMPVYFQDCNCSRHSYTPWSVSCMKWCYSSINYKH